MRIPFHCDLSGSPHCREIDVFVIAKGVRLVGAALGTTQTGMLLSTH